MLRVITITLNFLSFLCQHTLGRFLPIDVDRLPLISHQRIITDEDRISSCPQDPPLSTSERTEFTPRGCLVFGYPSTGGILVKEADLVDLLFLSLPRSHAVQRPSSADADEEDEFCRLLRRAGPTWWPSKREWLEALIGMGEIREEEREVLVFGWPVDGVGVWVLKFLDGKELPRDFGRIGFAMGMEEKIQIIREYGATFIENVSQVEELKDGYEGLKGSRQLGNVYMEDQILKLSPIASN
ncbi:hypothetical protein BJY01DRAFT_215828 [Aspergillus pseudoustus]|uniref:Fungal-type protein kinase domain-containing protein n=1 Tax=Aspergillus pseudoustus TaxID=1810923 RepID=A0ABR4JTK3_9EURO